MKWQNHMGSMRIAKTTGRRRAGSLFFEDLRCGSLDLTTPPVNQEEKIRVFHVEVWKRFSEVAHNIYFSLWALPDVH